MLKKNSKILLASIVCISGMQIGTAHAKDYYALYKIPLDKQKKPTKTTAALIRGAAPNMPYSANRSGYCCMLIDVTKDGLPINIKASHCTEKKFKKPSVSAVKHWRFNPANIDGTPVKTTNQSHIMTYLLTDEKGRVIQNKRKQLQIKNGRPVFSMEQVCTGHDIG